MTKLKLTSLKDRQMKTSPIKLHCKDLDDFPSPEALIDLTQGEQRVEVKLACSPGEERLRVDMTELSTALPGHFISVVSEDLVRIQFVVSAREVLENRLCIVLAARNFRILSNALGSALANKLAVTTVELSKADFRCRTDQTGKSLWERLFGTLFSSKLEGRLNRHWEYAFHGYEICFRSKEGLVLDVNLGFPSEFGTLDPQFFAEFVSGPIMNEEINSILESNSKALKSFMTASRIHGEVHDFFKEDYLRTSLALEILELAGELECLEPSDRRYRNPRLIVC